MSKSTGKKKKKELPPTKQVSIQNGSYLPCWGTWKGSVAAPPPWAPWGLAVAVVTICLAAWAPSYPEGQGFHCRWVSRTRRAGIRAGDVKVELWGRGLSQIPQLLPAGSGSPRGRSLAGVSAGEGHLGALSSLESFTFP